MHYKFNIRRSNKLIILIVVMEITISITISFILFYCKFCHHMSNEKHVMSDTFLRMYVFTIYFHIKSNHESWQFLSIIKTHRLNNSIKQNSAKHWLCIFYSFINEMSRIFWKNNNFITSLAKYFFHYDLDI